MTIITSTGSYTVGTEGQLVALISVLAGEWRMSKGDHLNEFMPYLMSEATPLWVGIDREFARTVQDAFGVPATIERATITPRVASGRAAVAVDGPDGAVVFVLTNDPVKRKLHIVPTLMGPPSQDPAVVTRANGLGGTQQITEMVTDLVKRKLGPAGALAFLIPEVH